MNFDPCQINAALAAITNQLYCSLGKKEFLNLGIFLSMLSKSMLSMSAIEELIKWEHRDDRIERARLLALEKIRQEATLREAEALLLKKEIPEEEGL